MKEFGKLLFESLYINEANDEGLIKGIKIALKKFIGKEGTTADIEKKITEYYEIDGQIEFSESSIKFTIVSQNKKWNVIINGEGNKDKFTINKDVQINVEQCK